MEAPAASAPSRPRAYAIVVGSNVGGPGQQPLRFAEDDAQRMAQVLRELGHYDPSDVRVLLHPDAAHVVGALDELAARVRTGAARGEPSQVVFYYSGHARADAVNLAGEELALSTLRERLSGLGASLTIVVLDACQSGAFARAKGAERAADFTYNSVSNLTQKGLAVLASSTSRELSQESDKLKASYFTHNLVTALRGAGDVDGDGRVSLDEAYRYAYRRTLAATALTQIGEQHATLETSLAGQGEVAVTYPAEAKAQLELPGPLDARVLVQHRPSGAIVAEVQKAAGAPIRLALVAGSYVVVVARKDGAVQCPLTLVDDQVTPLDATSCAPAVPDAAAAKGDGDARGPADGEGGGEPEVREISRWSVEGAAGLIWRQNDGYTDRLAEFGYQHKGGFLDLQTGRFTLGVARTLTSHFSTVLQIGTLAGDTFQRAIAASKDTASFGAYAATLYFRASTDLEDSWLNAYVQAGAGLSLGVLDYDTQQTGVPPSSSSTYVGYVLSAAAGARVGRRSGLFVQLGYDYAPTIHDLIGDTHDSGGPSVVFGVHVALGGRR